jgi:predicted transcriptional regulator
MSSTVTKTIENEHLGVLEGLFDSSAAEAAKEQDMTELCLRVYAVRDKMKSEDLVRACQEEWGAHITRPQLIQAVNRMVSSGNLIQPGLVEKTKENGETMYGITEKGLAYLWKKFANRTSEGTLDKYAKVIALNKKLNHPERHIESHDLYALTLLAVSKLEGKPATPTDVRKVLESWVSPTGINAQVLESEKSYTNPQTRFQRKFHNMFSSHNQILREGLIEQIDVGDESAWRVTEKGLALLMKRTLKEKRNLNLQMSASLLSKDLGMHVGVLQALGRYEGLAKTEDEKKSVSEFSKLVLRLVQEDSQNIHQIKAALATPETASVRIGQEVAQPTQEESKPVRKSRKP